MYQNIPQQPSEVSVSPEKTNGLAVLPVTQKQPRSRRFLIRGAAAALSLCLLGGAAGAGTVWCALGGIGAPAGQSASVTPVILNTAASGASLSDSQVYAAAVNSVVSINTTSQAGVNIFGQPVQSASSGFGFILSGDGYILTNYHVVKDASTVEVTTYGGDVFQAAVVGGDADYDIAVLKVSASGLQSASLGDSDTLNVGDHVLAIGNPLGELTFSLSGGMVSSVNRAVNISGTPFHVIQTDASINPGNSGGPLLNSAGEVVGIVSAKYSSRGGQTVEGLGFAIPINDVRAMVQDIIDNGYVTNKPYLGVTAGTVNAQMSQQAGLVPGVYLYAVETGGPAAAAGLQAGDIITQIDGTDIQSMTDFTAVKKTFSAGDTSQFTVTRAGQTKMVSVTWGAAPASQGRRQADSGSFPYGGVWGQLP